MYVHLYLYQYSASVFFERLRGRQEMGDDMQQMSPTGFEPGTFRLMWYMSLTVDHQDIPDVSFLTILFQA